ncbi:MAG TPA: tetratricopeptide repeat protein [Caulobacteraceae bacterium]|jgi:tetratricopeptide (TPR) repeat protein
MAENGFLKRFFGREEDDGGEGDVPATALDPAAAAAAMDVAHDNSDLAAKAAAYFEEQARLVRIQREHLHEQRAVQLSNLKLRRFTERLKAATQVFIILVVTILGLGVLVLLYDASRSKAVIVEPFDVPPGLTARGLTGKVVAGGVLDALTQLQTATRSSSAQRHLANAWTGDIKVEVPETGVSVGDIDRMLKARFGRDIHIDGNLVQSDAGGVALTVRGDGVLPRTFEGGPADLDRLTTAAAEYVYGQAEPALYAEYLTHVGRNADALAFSKAAYATASKADRPYLLNAWANALVNTGASPQQSLPLYRAALKLKPDYWAAYNNIMSADLVLGDEEALWRGGVAMLKASTAGRGRAPEIYFENWNLVTWNLQAWRESAIADSEAHSAIGSADFTEAPLIADIDVRLHDPADAELRLQTAKADVGDPSLAAMTHFVRGKLALEAGDARGAAAEMEAFGAAYANPIVSGNYAGYDCWIAPAEEAAGRPDKADAALTAGGHFVDCYRFRGDILDHRGDWAGAQKAYAQAVALAPDLPAGYYSWGLALARHGDLAGAIARQQAANQRGPHWADPLKAWGDVLARQGRWREARAKYEQALKYAPEWSQLRQARAATIGKI